MIEHDLTPVKNVEMCEDDHVIFTGKYADALTYHMKTCQKERYVDVHNKVPAKKLPYLPL